MWPTVVLAPNPPAHYAHVDVRPSPTNPLSPRQAQNVASLSVPTPHSPFSKWAHDHGYTTVNPPPEMIHVRLDPHRGTRVQPLAA